LCFVSIHDPLSRMGNLSEAAMLARHGESSADERRSIGGFMARACQPAAVFSQQFSFWLWWRPWCGEVVWR
jgi:hypothetical protein